MKEVKERRINLSLESKEGLIELIVDDQIKLFDLENKLNNTEKVIDEDYVTKLRERLGNLNVESLKKYYSLLRRLVIEKQQAYEEKVAKEQNELLNQLIEEYLGEEAANMPILPERILHDAVVVEPGHHVHFPWEGPWGPVICRRR